MLEECKSPSESDRAQQPLFFTRIWFEELGLPRHVLSGLKDCGFTLCTPLQSQVIPLALSGKDVVAQAVTGAGKIAAYLLPLMARLPERAASPQGNTTALIVVPTPELARHVAADVKLFGGTYTALSHAVADELECIEPEENAIAPDIIIGTPPALINMIKHGSLRVSTVNVLVVDEADRYFDLNLVKDLRYLLRKLPHHEKRRSTLFANSLSYRILALAYHYMNAPEFVSGATEEPQLQGIEQSLFHVDSREKASLLLGILKRQEWKRILIFANTQGAVEELSRTLKENGLPLEYISEEVPPRKRFRLIARLNRGGPRILVTTDAGCGSVFMEGVSHVVNYDLPLAPSAYLQRVGRISATAGARRAISFACEEYVFHLEAIEEALGYKIPVIPPDDDWFVKGKVQPSEEEPKAPKEPEPKTAEIHEEKRPLQLKGGAKIVFSSSPGGVFGLAVERTGSQEHPDHNEHGQEGRKKQRRRRPKRREPRKTENVES
ncbi:MAG: DEAD/DEAH box helicase [Desulfobacteraceae bacterium]|nr:MAG: DEAD/DEAH box helicase [Desulfobacteraceae bacterium]